MPTTSEVKRLFIDIETGLSPDYELFKPEFKDPRVTQKGEVDKRDKTIEEQETEWKSKLALSPLTGQVLMIGYNYVNSPCLDYVGKGSHSDEKQLLLDADSILCSADLIIGHNIKDFDLPFIVNRCRKHGITPPKIGYHKGSKWYWNDNVIDTMELWGAGKWKDMVSLNNLCKYFGIPVKDESIGKNFQQIFETDIEKAIEYCKGDVERTKLIYERLK